MIVYKFSSSTCGPCRMLKPIWDDIVKSYSDKGFTFEEYVIDTDSEAYSLAMKLNVNKVPTIIILNDKMELVDRFEGMINKTGLKMRLEKYLVN